MECYSEQICALAVDGELAPDEAQRLRGHLLTCRRCRELVDALRAENRLLSESLQELPEEAPSLAGFSHRHRSWVWGDLAVLAVVLALGSITSIWFDALSVPAALEWFNPFSASGRTNLLFTLFDQFASGGTAMLTDYAAVVGFVSLVLLVGGGALLLGRGRLRQPGLRLLIMLLALSLPSFALERRHREIVTVRANETVEDTLLASGTIVRVDGVVNGASWADSFDVGEHLVYTNECRFTDSSVACFIFKKLADQGRPHMLAIGKDQLVSWTNWFKEIGPERGARGDK